MRNHADGTPGVPSPSNVFSPELLRRFDEMDEPATASEAEVAGLGTVQHLPDGRYAVYLSGGGTESELVGVFREKWRALVTAAVLPGTGRDPLVMLRKEPEGEGYPLLAGLDSDGQPDVVGHLRLFDQDLAFALHVIEALMRLPEGMATVVQATGKAAVERMGTHLDRRLPRLTT